MEEIIKIQERDGKKAVSARELYDKLGFASQHWANWYKKNITNNQFAVEYEDFVQLPLSGRTLDFALSIDFAKRLSMLARTETGEKIRNYFIECEKIVQQTAKPLSQIEILVQSANLLLEQEKRLGKVENKVLEIDARTKTRPDYFTIVGFATLRKIKCGLQLASSLGKKATSLCKSKGYQMEEIPDPRFGRVKTYPLSILEEVFDMPVN